jgi:hypothetical protein
VTTYTNNRVAFCGASGTGKSTLMRYVAEKLSLPTNPVGSRSVAKEMGFESPYDVDKAGKRAEFQKRLIVQKMLWEEDHESFVTDRTTFDNLVYTMLHDIRAVTEDYFEESIRGMYRYTHVVYCPVKAFCDPGDDAARIKDLTYHRLYDDALWGLLYRHVYEFTAEKHRHGIRPAFMVLDGDILQDREHAVEQFLTAPYKV